MGYRVEGGGWRAEVAGLRVKGGGWRVEGGGGRAWERVRGMRRCRLRCARAVGYRQVRPRGNLDGRFRVKDKEYGACSQGIWYLVDGALVLWAVARGGPLWYVETACHLIGTGVVSNDTSGALWSLNSDPWPSRHA